MNSVQQLHEHHHWKVLIKNFHLSGHTLDSSGFRHFLGLVEGGGGGGLFFFFGGGGGGGGGPFHFFGWGREVRVFIILGPTSSGIELDLKALI